MPILEPTDDRYHARLHAAARTTDDVFSQLIPYLGNKRKLLPLIGQAIAQTGETGAMGGLFVDFFAGSGVVARSVKRAGFRVLANDWEPYAHALNRAAIACNALPTFAALGGAAAAFAALNAAPPSGGRRLRHQTPLPALGRAPRSGHGAAVLHTREWPEDR